LLFVYGIWLHYGADSGISEKWLELLRGGGIVILGASYAIADLTKVLYRRKNLDDAVGRVSRLLRYPGILLKLLLIYWLILMGIVVHLGLSEDGASRLAAISDSDVNGIIIMAGIAGLYWAVRSSTRRINRDIQPAEAVRWVPGNAALGGLLGLVLAALVYEMVSHMALFTSDIHLDRVYFFVYLGLIGAFFGGFQKVAFVSETRPNHGITRSAKRAVSTSLVMTGLSGGLTLLFLFMNATDHFVDFTRIDLVQVLKSAAAIGLSFGIFAALRYGLMDVVLHYILRLLLVATGRLPLDIAKFLDFAATELQFLQKVGGGYIFMHRKLLEYFAALADREPDAKTSVSEAQAVR
jgi:hypothetical protein